MARKYLKWLLLIVLIPVLYVVGVLGYAYLTDFQPEASTPLKVEGQASAVWDEKDMDFTCMTWNLGFAGMGKEMDFFYDGGTTMRNEQSVVEKNIQGIVETLSDSVDCFFFQEIDKKAKRSYNINQVEKIADRLSSYQYVFGKNYDVKFVPMPFTNPMGNVLGGIATFSKYPLLSPVAYAYKNTYHFPDYLFYLDRCFTKQKIALPSGKHLVLINSHNSAYDPEGKMKAYELEQLKAELLAEYAQGNYVIAGGDWNQYPPDYKGVRGYKPEDSSEGAYSKKDYPAPGWQWVWDSITPSNRSAQAPYVLGKTPVFVLDYFLISPNVAAVSARTLDLGFDFSDHQPVYMKIKFK